EVMAALNGFIAAVEMNDRPLALARIERARSLADEIGQPSLRWQVKVQEGRLAALSGEFARAEDLISEALELGQAANHTEAESVYAIQIYYLRFLQARLDTLAPLVRQATGVLLDQPLAHCA